MNDTAPASAHGQALPHLRASDADRDRVAEVLSTALSEGRLTHDEHSERLDALYAAKTLGELAPLTQDLPAAAGAGARHDLGGLTRSPEGVENIRSVLGAAERKGRWLVEPRTNVSVVLGSVSLDMREAVLSQREVTVQSALMFSTLEVVVPPGVRVVSRMRDTLSTVELKTREDPAVPAPPTVVLEGGAWLSTVTVRTKEPKSGRWGR
ncbi:DUF1707 SHOCT-like domain-containing protein [Streptomonospora nanhaiensis]|uniref:DUF1707 SHOCT-like domain-containing protein n=1 Tax=Streptomonospora nanhaiensis TaxID=1323731 RepID=UPI001C38712D|nr:DUF1707 domain-containing protein [Streptomonospora nanhaiensis]MBV2363861.1 DUF1707 domain-containing protein [Streptomonospora nanhaiensis]